MARFADAWWPISGLAWSPEAVKLGGLVVAPELHDNPVVGLLLRVSGVLWLTIDLALEPPVRINELGDSILSVGEDSQEVTSFWEVVAAGGDPRSASEDDLTILTAAVAFAVGDSERPRMLEMLKDV